MLPDVQNLIDLQQADREVLRLKEEIAALPKRVAAIEEKLAGTKAVLETAKMAVKADEANRRKYETAIKDVQQKISKYRDQSLEVKTNEQYRALMHEIQFAEQDIRANEDKILELMVAAEAREKSVKAAELELKAEMAEIEKEKTEARERTVEDEKQLAEWNAKRDKARAGVSPDFEGLGEAFLAFVNAQGSSSRRVYDAHTGRKVGDTEFQPGEFTTAFADDIGSAIRLKGGLEEQQLDEWAEELPMVILDELNADLKVASAEKSHLASETSRHPAAS